MPNAPRKPATDAQRAAKADYDTIYVAANREKKKVQHAAWYAANREEILAKEAVDHAAHPEEGRARARTWYYANPERAHATRAAYRAAHPEDMRLWRETHAEECKAYRRENYVANAEREKANTAAWAKANPEKVAATGARRRARKANAPVVDFQEATWPEVQAAYDHRCVYCGKRCKGKLTKDHLTPYAKGGSHTLHNIVPACRSCNSRKKDGAVLVPVQPLLLVTERLPMTP